MSSKPVVQPAEVHRVSERREIPVFSSKLPMSSVLSAASMILAITASPTTNAQDAVAQGSLLEEIVVTARRVEENIQDAPLAVAVMNDEYLRAQKIVTTEDILELSPGGVWNKFAKAQPGANIRVLDSRADSVRQRYPPPNRPAPLARRRKGNPVAPSRCRPSGLFLHHCRRTSIARAAISFRLQGRPALR